MTPLIENKKGGILKFDTHLEPHNLSSKVISRINFKNKGNGSNLKKLTKMLKKNIYLDYANIGQQHRVIFISHAYKIHILHYSPSL